MPGQPADHFAGDGSAITNSECRQSLTATDPGRQLDSYFVVVVGTGRADPAHGGLGSDQTIVAQFLAQGTAV